MDQLRADTTPKLGLIIEKLTLKSHQLGLFLIIGIISSISISLASPAFGEDEPTQELATTEAKLNSPPPPTTTLAHSTPALATVAYSLSSSLSSSLSPGSRSTLSPIWQHLSKIPGFKGLTAKFRAQYWLGMVAAAWGGLTLYQWWQRGELATHLWPMSTIDPAPAPEPSIPSQLNGILIKRQNEPDPSPQRPDVPPLYARHNDESAYSSIRKFQNILSMIKSSTTAPSPQPQDTYYKKHASHYQINHQITEWYEHLEAKYHQMSDQHWLKLARQLFISAEHLSQLTRDINLHRQHLRHSPYLLAIYHAFVLNLADNSMAEITSELNIDLNEIKQITQKLSDELIIYTHFIPKIFDHSSHLEAYQTNVLRILAQFETAFFNDYKNLLSPLKSTYLHQLATHDRPSPFGSATEAILFKAAHLRIPTIERQHLWELLDISHNEAHRLMARHHSIGRHFLTKTSSPYHLSTLEDNYFNLDYHHIQDLYTRHYDLLHLKSISAASFYHQLSSFYHQQLTSDIQRHLFLTFVVNFTQPSIITVRQMIDHFHLPITASHYGSVTGHHSTPEQFLQGQLQLVITQLKDWFHSPFIHLHQDFATSAKLNQYFHHRSNEITEHDLLLIAKLWGITSGKQQLTFPMQFQKFMQNKLSNPYKFNVFCAYILHWNPLPLHQFAQLHGVSTKKLKRTIQTLFHQFQTELHRNSTADEFPSPSKILEDLYLKFSQLNDPELTALTQLHGFAHIDPIVFSSLITTYLETSRFNTHKSILFFAKVLQLSGRSHLEWDHIFALYQPTQNHLPSLITHLEIEKKFRDFLAANHPETQFTP